MLLRNGCCCSTQVSHLKLFRSPDLPALRCVLIEEVVLSSELQVVILSILHTNLEGVERIALEFGFAIEIHVLKCERTSKSHCARTALANIFLDSIIMPLIISMMAALS